MECTMQLAVVCLVACLGTTCRHERTSLLYHTLRNTTCVFIRRITNVRTVASTYTYTPTHKHACRLVTNCSLGKTLVFPEIVNLKCLFQGCVYLSGSKVCLSSVWNCGFNVWSKCSHKAWVTVSANVALWEFVGTCVLISHGYIPTYLFVSYFISFFIFI